jgi:hypothetical protein
MLEELVSERKATEGQRQKTVYLETMREHKKPPKQALTAGAQVAAGRVWKALGESA